MKACEYGLPRYTILTWIKKTKPIAVDNNKTITQADYQVLLEKMARIEEENVTGGEKMKYIDSIYVDGFRGFKNFKLSNLKDINILVGENNTGKTSILEAIHILEYPGEIGNYINVCRQREGKGKISPYNIFENSISKDDSEMIKKVEIEATMGKKDVCCQIQVENLQIMKILHDNSRVNAFEGVIIHYGDSGGFKTYENKLYIDEETDRLIISNKDSYSPVKISRVMPFDHIDKEILNIVIKEGKKQDLIDALRIFDKEIMGIETLKEDNEIKTYIQHKTTGLLPISAYGDGLKKVVYLSSVIVDAKGGVLLIDEIETALHYSAMKDVFKWIIKAANEYKVQIFATTHSSEVLDALLESAMEYKGEKYLEESINIITLKKGEEHYKTKVRVLDGHKAYKFREDFNMELRG